MSTTAEPLDWHDQRDVYGFTVKAFFFDADAADLEPTFVRRVFPIFKVAIPRLITTEKHRRNFRVSTVVAQPDAVLEHGQGLLSLEYKPQDTRKHRRDRWHEDIPVRGMLQCLVAAIAVSSELERPAVPLLRCHNVLYLLKPYTHVLNKALKLFASAPDYWEDYPDVSSSRIAKYMEAWVREKFPNTSPEALERQRRGEELHARMLRI